MALAKQSKSQIPQALFFILIILLIGSLILERGASGQAAPLQTNPAYPPPEDESTPTAVIVTPVTQSPIATSLSTQSPAPSAIGTRVPTITRIPTSTTTLIPLPTLTLLFPAIPSANVTESNLAHSNLAQNTATPPPAQAASVSTGLWSLGAIIVIIWLALGGFLYFYLRQLGH